MTPMQVLERQHGFLLRYEHEPDFQKYVHGCFDAANAWSIHEALDSPSRYTEATLQSFLYGEAYRVVPDMCDLVQYAADRLDSTDTFDRDLAPTPFGFVVFEKPLPVWDARGEKMLCHFMTWCPASIPHSDALHSAVKDKPGTWITMWNDSIVTPDETFARLARGIPARRNGLARDLRSLERLMGHWGFIGTEAAVTGQRIGSMRVRLRAETLDRMIAEDQKFAEEGIEIPPPVGEHTNSLRYVHALWLLLGQTITSAREEALPKAGQKIARRMRIPGRVTVIQLRRQEHRKSDGETDVQWQHRWLVRGHWRWQPYHDGRVERIWIHGFVKGPEGLPFKQTEKIYDLRR